ncbi:carotenoid cleavage dioxygenase [Methylobacterium phyllostachyos]|uniref:Dioxygenase n=1 Tax=Methylobacterium phyllostachyos TaxID=582672 RepID=A0A1H0EIA3_9HYPH|nr:carotenoid cleavage dioxygenase [Methylobacterium phyllostachyos]
MAIPVAHGPCIHDCAFTARFVIVLDLPVTFSFRALLAGYRFPFRWNPRHGARVGLLPRQGDGADILRCEVDPCFVFHIANAYEDADGQVILDVIAYATVFTAIGGGLDEPGRLGHRIPSGFHGNWFPAHDPSGMV